MLERKFLPLSMITVLNEYANEKTPGRLLDLGCGDGRTMRVMAKRARNCVGVDVNLNALQQAKQYGDVYMRIGEAPLDFLDNDNFDLVIAIDIFHHLELTELALSGVYRCLKPGGVFIFKEIVEDSLFCELGVICLALGKECRY